MRKEVTKTRSLKAWWSSLWPSFREVNVMGARARYLCNGSGPPLLLLASPLAFGRSYMRAVHALCRSFTVVCVELPGSGGSERLEQPWSAARYAEWVLELVRYLPLAAPIVVGHGSSAAIAAEVARIAPDEIGGIVLADTPATGVAFGVRSLSDVVLNAVRHRTSFAEHMKNARTGSLHPALGAGAAPPVPTLRAGALTDDWKAIRRFVAQVRRGAHGLPAPSARPAFAT